MPAPPSPYEYLLKRGQVESLRERAGAYVGYKAALADEEHPTVPQRLLRDLPSFALSVLRLCRAYTEIQNFCNAFPDAEPRDADDAVDQDAPHRRRVAPPRQRLGVTSRASTLSSEVPG
jgi:hypothetical protein